MAGVLTSCAGSSSRVEPPVGPWLTAEVVLTAEGDARVGVLAQGVEPSTLGPLAVLVANEVFPSAQVGLASTSSDDVTASAHVTVHDALGEQLQVLIPGPAFDPTLRATDAADLRLSVCVPAVSVELTASPSTDRAVSGRCTVFIPSARSALPRVSVVLRPEAWRWAVGALGALLALGLAIASTVRRRRSLAAGALVALGVALVLGLGAVDDAVLAGLLPSGAIRSLTAVVAVAGLVALGVAAATLRRPAGSESRPSVPVH